MIEKEKTQRVYWLDTIRVIACLMVVFMHAPVPDKENPLTSSYLLGALSYLTFPCIGLFFMVSGALILPVKMHLNEFLKKRFSRILFPTIIWSLFYITVKYLYNEADVAGVAKLILQMPFSAVEGVLWFMYTLTGLYLFAPVISKWIESANKREIEYLLILWLVVMCFPYIRAFINISEGDYNILSTFSGFLGYMVLGYYLKKYPVNLSSMFNKIKAAVCFFGFSVVLPAIFYIGQFTDFDPGTVLYNYLSISIVSMCVFWFILIQNLTRLHTVVLFTKVMKELSSMSFGIYLVHIFVMRRLIWNWIPVGALPLWLEIVVVAMLTFFLSYLVVKIISRFRFSKYIIG